MIRVAIYCRVSTEDQRKEGAARHQLIPNLLTIEQTWGLRPNT